MQYFIVSGTRTYLVWVFGWVFIIFCYLLTYLLNKNPLGFLGICLGLSILKLRRFFSPWIVTNRAAFMDRSLF